MASSLVVLCLTGVLLASSAALRIKRPTSCAAVTCLRGYACVKKFVVCVRAPCPPLYRCVSMTPKSGICPKMRYPVRRSGCKYDSECYGRKKCCGGRCVNVAKVVKPGTCPRAGIGPCVVRCRDDSDCQGRLKCCGSCPRECKQPVADNTCAVIRCRPGYACVTKSVVCVRAPCPPLLRCVRVRPKPGKCPKTGVTALGPRRPCVYDSQCRGREKCCRGHCANPARSNKPGKCPSQRGIGPCIAKCATDSDCPGRLKCCGNCPRECKRPEPSITCRNIRCARGYACVRKNVVCVKPPCLPVYGCVSVRPKPGKCPKTGVTALGPRRPCVYDSQCRGREKCCRGHCAIPARSNKPGKCPPPRGIGPCIAKCATDRDCRGILKCCGSCPRECKIPVPSITCANIRCARGYACVRKNVVCVKPPCLPVYGCVSVRPKPGKCPKTGVTALGYRRPCVYDSQCRGREKCCRGHCAIPARSNKPGKCPRQRGIGPCIAKCATDRDCRGILKCCGSCPRECKIPVPSITCANILCMRGYACVRKHVVCVKPPCLPVYGCVSVRPKPGKCPKTNVTSLGIYRPCVYDSQCDGREKCCLPRRHCTLPARSKKPGKCPPQRGIGPCIAKCATDRDCRGILKCCGNCPRECKIPVPSITCANILCMRGYACVRKHVVCVKPPCLPVYGCVSVRPKPGKCPKTNVTSLGIHRPCVYDSQCDGREKCCLPRRHCTLPARSKKPGKCPPQRGIGPCIAKCATDRDCRGILKCCGNCPRECKIPVPSITCANILCMRGYACVRKHVVCVKPPCLPVYGCVSVRPKPGKCPKTNVTSLGIHRPCVYDSQCDGREKCCLPRRHCTLPARSKKPGKCPPQRGIGPCIAKCATDRDCRGILKCCGNCPRECKIPVPSITCANILCMRGYACVRKHVVCVKPPCLPVYGCVSVRPKPGKCPKTNVTSLGIHRPCVYDSQCDGREKCCLPRRHCTLPARSNKPGKCPPQRGIGPCIAKCATDRDCRGILKCCGNCPRECKIPVPSITCANILCMRGYACVRKHVVCVKPPCLPVYGCVSVRPKPGKCPKTNVTSLGIHRPCVYDSQCDGREKCCLPRRHCTLPARSNKPGKCPRQNRIGPCIAKCTTDKDCPGKLKCCGGCPRECKIPVPSTTCAKRCRRGYACARLRVVCKKAPCRPVYGCVRTKRKPGICGKRRTSGLRCRYDSQCPGRQKCCNGFCHDPFRRNKCGGCRRGYVCVPVRRLCRRYPCRQMYRCINRKPKRGSCPRTRFPRRRSCRYDSQCYGKRKCCSGRCLNPVKADRCGGCRAGYRCLGVRKVCRRGRCRLLYRCVSTRAKAGVCPRSRRFRVYKQCRYDRQCAGRMKCCNGRCRYPARINRCGGCRRGYKCVYVRVLCRRYPCRPAHRCISTRPKRGRCPRTRRNYNYCRYDSQCYGRRKCCRGRCLFAMIG